MENNRLTMIFEAGGKKKNFVVRNSKDEVEASDVKNLMQKIIEKEVIRNSEGNPVTKIVGAKNIKTKVEEINLD